MKETILIEVDRKITHIGLLALQSQLYRETGEKYTNNQAVYYALQRAFGKSHNEAIELAGKVKDGINE